MNRYAIVIIDMQNAYFHNEELRERQEDLVQGCNMLLVTGKRLGLPMYMVRTEHRRDQSTWTRNMLADKQGYLFKDDTDSDVVDGLRTESATPIIKTRDSAFYGTDLSEKLRADHIDTIVLAGVSTHGCVLMTAADAYARNIHVVLVEDAIASHDMNFHKPVLDMLQQEYRQQRLRVDEIVARLNSQAELRNTA